MDGFSGITYLFSTNGFVLDDGKGTFYDGTRTVPDAGSRQHGYLDSPRSPVSTTIDFFRVAEFKVYTMYKPSSPGSIWVTVGFMEWNWNGHISRSTQYSSWTLGANGYTVDPVGSASSELPTWNGQYK